MSSERKFLRLKILQERHRFLNKKVDLLNEIRNPNNEERDLIQELKVRKLRCKDAIARIARENE